MLIKNKIVLITLGALLALFAVAKIFIAQNNFTGFSGEVSKMQVLSIDTMKYSRDIARERLNDTSFNQTIEIQVKDIADTGATHIAIGTPYDQEFLPYLTRWVEAARKYNLKVWFRGNFAGWEEWFEYPAISQDEHLAMIVDFIESNPQLFEDGDIFSTCPECENGGPGDPRMTGKHAEYRQFLIAEYNAANQSFRKVNKNVASNYFSMNGDVARLIMDKNTTAALDGIVVIDHYVLTPEKLVSDARAIAQSSGGKIVLGEFGVPIPDIHGTMSESEQTEWLKNALNKIYQTPEIIGMNYWTNLGGTTQIWDTNGSARSAVNTIANYYSRVEIEGQIIDELNRPIDKVNLRAGEAKTETNSNGRFNLALSSKSEVELEKHGYKQLQISAKDIQSKNEIVLEKENPDLLFIFLKNIINLLRINI